MTFANVVCYVAILGVMIYRRIQGKPAGSTKQLFVLPILLIVLGYQDLAHKSLDTVDVVFAVAGCALSLALGALRGSLDKISARNGTPWVQWGAASVIVFMVNIAAKLILDVISVVAGGTTSGATSSLVLAAGLMLAGEAVVVWLRLQAGQPWVAGDQATTPQPEPGPTTGWVPPAVGAQRPDVAPLRVGASRLAEGLLRRLAERRAED